ncbi:MAG: class I SAM-dependent methyltransferase [Defluviitaleaceae bacterium]|nr:class I SAM-dependent methyltransferase [Defluviitaleaceae bacterium]
MYQGFASMYDALMHDAPYEVWAAYIDGFLAEWFKKPRAEILVLDLACGTGNITLLLADMGYDLIGVDVSEDMLAEANRKAYEQNAKILFLAQDMQELNLYGTVDAAISVCDGFSYILEEDDLLTAFKRVRLFLNPDGVFIFDMNTEYKFKELFSNKILEGSGIDGEGYEWQNDFDEKTGINEYRITFFSEKEEPFEELHRQRAYSPTVITNLLIEAGFSSVKIRDGYSNDPLTPESARVVFIAD